MMIHYPFPLRITLKICFAILKCKPLSFREDALQAVRSLSSQFLILGKEFIPSRGPCLVTVNHYHREGFSAWWIPFAISSAIPIDVHWLITAAWRFEGKLMSKVLEYFSRKIIRGIARVYGFTTTPPMPPDPGEVKEGAASIRKLLKFADTHPQAFIGLAPEGRDSISGELLPPPPGSGRLIGHLANRGYCILPAAIYEALSQKKGTAPSCLVLRFGPAYTIEIPRQASPQERDALFGQKVMGAIADLL
jgi:hypothetical protein